LAGVLLALLFVVVIAFAGKRPYLFVGWLWFVGMLVPVIGLVQVGVQSMADRYTYVPLIGILIIIVWGIGDVIVARTAKPLAPEPGSASRVPASTHPHAKATPSASVGAMLLPWSFESIGLGCALGLSLLLCATQTLRQLQFWRNSETLFTHAVRVTKGNYLAYNNLGFYLSSAGKPLEAMENYKLSLEINPQYEDALNNMGFALAAQKKYLEAIPYYERALRVRPRHVEVHNNLGNALSELGRIDEAISHYRIVLEQKPDHADAHNNLGVALAIRGQLDEAIGHFHSALKYKPTDASAHSNLGNAFAVQRKLDEAIAEYRESLRLKPDEPQAHNNLGNALAEKGLLAEAVSHYENALRLNADNPEAHFNLGMALARQGLREQALLHYTAALRLKPDYAEARRQMEAISAAGRK